MNASEITKMRNANSQFCYVKKNVLETQQNCYSDKCFKLSSECKPFQYDSYAEKYLLIEGAFDMSQNVTPPTMYNNKLGFYTLGIYDGYTNYQYRFYDGWGPLIDSGIDASYTIDEYLYTSLGFQSALFFDDSGNCRLQLLDSTGFIIDTIKYKCNMGMGPETFYISGSRYGILLYNTPSDISTIVLIDPLYNTKKTFTSTAITTGYGGVTGSGIAFILNNGIQNLLYVWNASDAQPYVALVSYNIIIPYTTPNMDHFVIATQTNLGYYDKISVLLAARPT